MLCDHVSKLLLASAILHNHERKIRLYIFTEKTYDTATLSGVRVRQGT